MVGRSLSPDDRGVGSSVIAFLIAGFIFTGSLVAILATTRDAGQEDSASQDAASAASLAETASNLADLLVTTPGSSDGGGPEDGWEDAADPGDDLGRLGLADEDQPGLLDYDKFNLLRQGLLDTNTGNDLVDYEEARASLGLSENQGFHIRAWPNLEEVREELCQPPPLGSTCVPTQFDADLRVGYVSDVESVVEQPPAPLLGDIDVLPGVNGGGGKLNVCIIFVNRAGQQDDANTDQVAAGTQFVIGAGQTPTLPGNSWWDDPGKVGPVMLPSITFTTPLALSKNLDSDPENDAACVSFTDVRSGNSNFAGHFYGRAVNPGVGSDAGGLGTACADNTVPCVWQPVRYNDNPTSLNPVNLAQVSYFDTSFYDGLNPGVENGQLIAEPGRLTSYDGHVNGIPMDAAGRTMVIIFEMDDTCDANCPTGPPQASDEWYDPPICISTAHPDFPAGTFDTSTAAYATPAEAQKGYVIVSTVRNFGLVPTQFHAAFVITPNPESGNTFGEWSNTGLIDPGEEGEVGVFIPAASPSYCANAASIAMSIWDPSYEQLPLDVWLWNGGVAAHTGPLPPHTLTLDTTKAYFKPSERPSVVLGGNGFTSSGAILDVYDDNGAETDPPIHTEVLSSAAGALDGRTHTFSRTFQAGEYSIVLRSLESGVVKAQTFETLLVAEHVQNFKPQGLDPPDLPYLLPASPLASTEVGYLHDLFENFCPFYADGDGHSPITFTDPTSAAVQGGLNCEEGRPTNHDGHVYADSQAVMNNMLPQILAVGADGKPEYLDVLIVGSGIDHGAMTMEAAQTAVQMWVQAGGHLIVLGSETQQITWLDNLFSAALETGSGELSSPDLDHPLLRVPYVVDPRSYTQPPPAFWKVTGPAAAHFATVAPGPQSQQGSSALAVSDPGAFELGRITLSAYQPGHLYTTMGTLQDLEGKHLLTNLVLIGYQDLFLDFGPPLPDDANVIPGVRSALIAHPQLGLVPVTLVIYVFDV